MLAIIVQPRASKITPILGIWQRFARDMLSAHLDPSFIFNHVDTMNAGPNFSTVTAPRKKTGLKLVRHGPLAAIWRGLSRIDARARLCLLTSCPGCGARA